MFIKRPNKNETEDDILRQQEEYLRSKEKNNKLSKTDQKASEKSTIQTDGSQSSDQHQADQVDGSATIGNVYSITPLSEPIIERDVVRGEQYWSIYCGGQQANQEFSNGFPSAPCLSTNVEDNKNSVPNGNSARKPSLYAQKYLHKKELNEVCKEKDVVHSNDIVTGIGLGVKEWKRQMDAIKEKNRTLIESMSKEEIEATREELLKKLDSKTVAFFRSKQFKYRSEVLKEKEMNKFKSRQIESTEHSTVKGNTINKSSTQNSFVNIEDKLAVSSEEVQTHKYMHMDVIEGDKLNWIGDIPPLSTVKSQVGNSSARFNFEGELIEFNSDSEQIDVHHGLHHHGEEPQRPGYTVNELFMYLQSSFPAQKVIGLKVFEKIITNAYQGMYDASFNTNLIEYLIKDTPLALVVRSCLDESTESVWKASISTLKTILCNTLHDELFLDRGHLIFEDYFNFGFQIKLDLQPTVDSEVEFDEQMPDQQFATYDLVQCLLQRTSILQRFAYLIHTYLYNDDIIFIEEIIDILIRMARHSSQAARTLVDQAELMEAVLASLTKHNIQSHRRLVHAKSFKLMRVCLHQLKLSGVSKSNVSVSNSLYTLFNRFAQIEMLDSFNLCLNFNPDDVSAEVRPVMLRICIESLRTWLQLLSLGKQYEHPFLKAVQNNYSGLLETLLKIKYLVPQEYDTGSLGTSTFDFQYASYVFMLLCLYQKQQSEMIYTQELYYITMSWLTILHNNTILPNFDTCQCILVLTEFILRHLSIDSKLISLINKLFNENESFVRKLLQRCMNNSNILLHETSGTVRDSPNHPSFGSIYFRRSHCVPLFNANSPICLLFSLLRISSTLQGSFQLASNTLRLLHEYISLVTENVANSFSPNIFDHIELNIVSQACLVVVDWLESRQKQLEDNESISRAMLKFAFTVNILNVNQLKIQLIERVAFSHVLYSMLGVDWSPITWQQIKLKYTRLSYFDDQYWMFQPILLPSEQKITTTSNNNDASDSKIKLEELIVCLEYIELVYNIFPEYFHKLDISASKLFLLISSVFLVDEGHFLNKDIKFILKRFLTNLVGSTSNCVIHRQTTGLPYHRNLSEYFTKLVSQFENCSYGDVTFINYLLVFFQPKCSPYFRNYFFSEHVFLIRMMHLSFEQMIFPMDNLLFPLDTNLETLEIYLKTLLCEALSPEMSPVLYCVMVHHLNHALFRPNSSLQKLLDNNVNSEAMNKSRFERLIWSVEKSQNQRLREHLYNYSHFDTAAPFGLALKSQT